MISTGDLIVRVLDDEGNPVPGAVVTANNTDAWLDKRYTGTTDSVGIIRFEGVNAGTVGDHYEITASAKIDGTETAGRVHKQMGFAGLKDIQADIVLSVVGRKLG